jgi:hypothetical protein
MNASGPSGALRVVLDVLGADVLLDRLLRLFAVERELVVLDDRPLVLLQVRHQRPPFIGPNGIRCFDVRVPLSRHPS